MDISFDFNVKFHYPYIFYGYEKNEIWIQKIDQPYVISRYVFINTITAFDYTDDVFYETGNNSKPPQSLRLILTYENHHKIAIFSFTDSQAEVRRIQKPIKFTELPNVSIISFAQIEGRNDKNKLEPCIMFHYMNQLLFYYLKSGKVRKHIDKKYSKRNIIQYDKRLFFWEDRGRSIERLETPISKDEKNFFYKAYDAKNVIKVSFIFT